MDLTQHIEQSRKGLESYRQDFANLKRRYEKILREKPQRLPRWHLEMISSIEQNFLRIEDLLQDAEKSMGRLFGKRKARKILYENYPSVQSSFLGLHLTWYEIKKLHDGLSMTDEEWSVVLKKNGESNQGFDMLPVIMFCASCG